MWANMHEYIDKMFYSHVPDEIWTDKKCINFFIYCKYANFLAYC